MGNREGRKRLLNYYLKVVKATHKQIPIQIYGLAIEIALLSGDTNLAMEFAGNALATIPEEKKVQVVADMLLPILVNRAIS